jgi:hypothetical protein
LCRRLIFASCNVVQRGDDGFFHGNLPVTGILRLPMLITTSEEFDKAAAIMRPYFKQAYAAKGVVLLAQYYYPLQVAWSRAPLAPVAIPRRRARVRPIGGAHGCAGGRSKQCYQPHPQYEPDVANGRIIGICYPNYLD